MYFQEFDSIPYTLVVPDYTYNAYIAHWVDGDTVDLQAFVKLDFGFHKYSHDIWKLRMRLIDLDTPERGKPNYHEATNFAEDMAPVGMLVKAKVSKMPTGYADTEKYGRYLVEIYTNTGSVNEALLASGFGKPYDGGTKTTTHPESPVVNEIMVK